MIRQCDDLRSKLTAKGGRLLVIQTAFLGDVVLLTPLLRAIRKALPLVRTSVVVQPEWSEVVAGWCDEIIPFAKKEAATRSQNWKELLEGLKRRQFDAALVPHRSLRSALTALKAGIPYRIGFKRGVGIWFHNIRVSYPRSLYEGRRNLALLEVLTDTDDGGFPELIIPDDDREFVAGRLRELGLDPFSFAVIAPASVWFTKSWPIRHYRDLVHRLKNEFQIAALVVGGRADAEICAPVAVAAKFNFAGQFSPLRTAALMAQSRFVISGDTAPAHLATAVGVRQLIIFGSTAPRFGFAPPTERARILGADIWCRPCTDHGRKRCPLGGSPRCLNEITVSMVVNSVRNWLE